MTLGLCNITAMLPSKGFCTLAPENCSVAPKGGRGPVWETLVQPLQLQLGFLR